jgi:hypothetical protein
MHFEQMVSKEPVIISLTGESTEAGIIAKTIKFYV